MKKFTIAIGLVYNCCFLIIAAFTPSYTASDYSKRVDVYAHKNGIVSIEEILKGEPDRIAFLKAKLLHVGEVPQYEQLQSSTQTPLYSGQTVGTGNYILKVGLGTPATDLLLFIDTGSDLAWTQCLPCDACYEQKDPIFDPTVSSSYQQVPCASAQCAQLGSLSSGTCHSTNATNCDYSITYLDGSFTYGDLALDALMVGGDPVSAAYPFGCGHNNQGLFKGAGGLLGLSRDPISFPAQTKAAFGEIFAYCMPGIFTSEAGYIEFGAGGAEGSESTPLVSETTVYAVELEYVQVVGGSSMSKPARSKAMVVDSGTVITRLDGPLYEQVRDAFKEAAAAAAIKEAPAGAGLGFFDACYTASNGEVFPSITFTFMGGLAFTPSAQNSVFPVDDNGTFCLALLPLNSSSGFSILGNYQQQHRLFTFDIAHSSLGISSLAC